MSYSSICFHCKCPKSDHTLPGGWCAVCTEMGASGIYRPDGAKPACEGFLKSLMCAVCGGRMGWLGPLYGGYQHANEEDDDHEPEPRTRMPRAR